MKQESGTPAVIVTKKKKYKVDMNRPKYWSQLLGDKIVDDLIKQAHKDAKIFKELVAKETKAYGEMRSRIVIESWKTRKEKEPYARKQLARRASAAT